MNLSETEIIYFMLTALYKKNCTFQMTSENTEHKKNNS